MLARTGKPHTTNIFFISLSHSLGLLHPSNEQHPKRLPRKDPRLPSPYPHRPPSLMLQLPTVTLQPRHHDASLQQPHSQASHTLSLVSCLSTSILHHPLSSSPPTDTHPLTTYDTLPPQIFPLSNPFQMPFTRFFPLLRYPPSIFTLRHRFFFFACRSSPLPPTPDLNLKPSVSSVDILFNFCSHRKYF